MGGILDYLRFFRLDWPDVIEITLVSYLIYRVLILWAGTRAFQILFGLVLLVAVYALADKLLAVDLGMIVGQGNRRGTQILGVLHRFRGPLPAL